MELSRFRHANYLDVLRVSGCVHAVICTTDSTASCVVKLILVLLKFIMPPPYERGEALQMSQFYQVM